MITNKASLSSKHTESSCEPMNTLHSAEKDPSSLMKLNKDDDSEGGVLVDPS